MTDNVEQYKTNRAGRPKKNIVGSRSSLFFASGDDRQKVSEFSYRLLCERVNRKMSQTAFAELMGLSQTQLSNIENGVFVPVPSLVFEIERALGFAPGFLSKHLGYVPAPKEADNDR